MEPTTTCIVVRSCGPVGIAFAVFWGTIFSVLSEAVRKVADAVTPFREDEEVEIDIEGAGQLA
jgi:hypothetical protein